MRADEKFNAIIDLVEDALFQKEIPPNRVLADRIAAQQGLGYRVFNTIFQFLTGMSFLDYIRRRRMNAAYATLVEGEGDDNFDLDGVIPLCGYEDERSFSRSFRERYHMTPRAAFKKKDKSLIEAPLSWKRLSEQEEDASRNGKKEEEEMEQTYLGLTRQQFEQISRARDLQLLYNFSDAQTDAAYRVALKNDISLEKAFDYVEAWCIYWKSIWIISKRTFDKSDADTLVEQDDLVYGYCSLGLTVSEALGIRDELEGTEYTLKDINERVFQYAKFHPDLPYGAIIQCDKGTGDYGTVASAFSEALDALEDGFDVETAIRYGLQEAEEADRYQYDLDMRDPVEAGIDAELSLREEERLKEEEYYDPYGAADWDDLPDEVRYGF